MKKLMFIIALLAFMVNNGIADDLLPKKSYPIEITEYVKKHFPSEKILRIEKDIDDNKAEYTVKLSNKMKLEFNSELKIVEIKARKYQDFPLSVFQPKILELLKKDYPNCKIKSWELDRNSQEIEIKYNNKLIELEFNSSGNLMSTHTSSDTDD